MTESNTETVADSNNPNVVRHQTAALALRDHFMKWQCKARQNAIRKSSGKPSESMCPNLIAEDNVLMQVVTLINKDEAYSQVPEIKHIVLRTQDPKKRYESGLELLAAEYYQDRREFSDYLTALFGPEEPLVEYLAQQGSCTLEFDRTRQYYSLPCEVFSLEEEDYLFQATYWHNQLFNPYMPPGVQVLAFKPDWSLAVADPEPV